ncbi:hypothetical protein NDU88_000465 [Pleurodeles waltl]|uniref:Uncharacterized protein n=1 Tax=Pleurodeles waltl TaxID=8319 RepID=A0AAV7VWP5_PLEWA|nr:hypothetical protein NDU88_000465 [Pleurodeles waltl]
MGAGDRASLHSDFWSLRSGVDHSQARVQRQPPSWFLNVVGRDPARLLSHYSFLAGIYSAFIGRDSAHRGLSCRSFSGSGSAIISAGPRSQHRSAALSVQLHRPQATCPHPRTP